MKRTIIIAAIAATTLLAPAAAMASDTSSVSDQGVGTVSKGTVQDMFDWNDAKLQQNAPTIKFSVKYQMDNETRWTCSDGSTNSQTSRVLQSRVLKTTAETNPHGKVLRWNLDGVDETKGGSYISGKRFGAAYVGFCSTGYATGFLSNVFTNTTLPGVQVNGVDLVA
jgi:hypothetical protein